MGSEMIRFESRELPEGDRFAALIREMEAVHQLDPFADINPRVNVRRALSVAKQVDLSDEFIVCRGELGMSGFGADHVWLSYGGCVIDPSYALLDEGFVDAFRDYILLPDLRDGIGHIAANNLIEFNTRAPVNKRPFGVFPDHFSYIGMPVFVSRQLHSAVHVRSKTTLPE